MLYNILVRKINKDLYIKVKKFKPKINISFRIDVLYFFNKAN